MTRQSPPIAHPEDSRIAVSLPCTANFAAAEGEPLTYKRIILHTLYICSCTGTVPAPPFYSPAENKPQIFNYITPGNSVTGNYVYSCSVGFSPRVMGFSPQVMGFSPQVMGFSPQVMGFSPQVVGFSPQVMGFSPRVMGFSPQVMGFSPRVVGFSPQVVGFSPQVMGYSPSIKRFSQTTNTDILKSYQL